MGGRCMPASGGRSRPSRCTVVVRTFRSASLKRFANDGVIEIAGQMACGEHLSEGDDYVTLSNRKRVRIRALQRGEERPIRELWTHLSPQTRYLRFLSMMATLPDSVIGRLVAVDDCTTMAFVAEHETDGSAIVVGLVNLAAVDDLSVHAGLDVSV